MSAGAPSCTSRVGGSPVVHESCRREPRRARVVSAGAPSCASRVGGSPVVYESCPREPRRTQYLTRLPSQTTSSRWQVDKKAIGLSRVQQFSHLCVARPYQMSVNSIFKHIHTTSINTIIWQFVPFIYHPL